MNNDKEYLLKLQSSVFKKEQTNEFFIKEWIRLNEGLASKQYTPEIFCKTFEISLEQFNNLTGYGFKDLINHKTLVEPFLDILNQNELIKLKDVIVGTLPKKSISAETYIGPFGTPLIIFHSGLIHVINHYKYIQAYKASENNSPHSKAYYRSELAKLQDFFSSNGRKRLTPIRIKNTQTVNLKSSLQVTLIKSFIMCHEYAHVFLDHIGEWNSKKKLVLNSDIPTKLTGYNINQIMEFEADKIAFSWYNRIVDRKIEIVDFSRSNFEDILIKTLPFEFLYLMNLLHGPGMVVTSNESFHTKNHPSFLSRLFRLHEITQSELNEDENERIEEMKEAAQLQSEIYRKAIELNKRSTKPNNVHDDHVG